MFEIGAQVRKVILRLCYQVYIHNLVMLKFYGLTENDPTFDPSFKSNLCRNMKAEDNFCPYFGFIEEREEMDAADFAETETEIEEDDYHETVTIDEK